MGGGGGIKALLQLANFTLGPNATLNTETHKNSVRIKAPNSVNASKRKHKNQIKLIKLITKINKDEYSWLILLYARVNENQYLNHGGPSQRHIVKLDKSGMVFPQPCVNHTYSNNNRTEKVTSIQNQIWIITWSNLQQCSIFMPEKYIRKEVCLC